MWLEAILTTEDLSVLLAKATLLKIAFGEKGSLELFRPSSVSLVPEVGLRVVCEAKVYFPLAGIAIPVTLRASCRASISQ